MATRRNIVSGFLSELKSAASDISGISEDDVVLQNPNETYSPPKVVFAFDFEPLDENAVGAGATGVELNNNGNVDTVLWHRPESVLFSVSYRAGDASVREDLHDAIYTHFKEYEDLPDYRRPPSNIHEDVEDIDVLGGTPSASTSGEDTYRDDSFNVDIKYFNITSESVDPLLSVQTILDDDAGNQLETYLTN